MTACSRAVEAWRSRRNVCAPSEERSRSSRRRRGLRWGLTSNVDVSEAICEEVVASESLVLWSVDGGSAEDCGAGGVDVDVELGVEAGDIVWKYFGVAE